MPPRCELSDLLRAQCAHCRGTELVAGYRLQIDQLDGLAGRLWRLRVWDTGLRHGLWRRIDAD